MFSFPAYQLSYLVEVRIIVLPFVGPISHPSLIDLTKKFANDINKYKLYQAWQFFNRRIRFIYLQN